jgi:hypothetical protein
MKFEITETPGAEWDEFVCRYTDVLFYYSIWGEVLKQGLGGRLHYSYIRDNGEIVGGMPGVFLRFPGIRLFYCSLPYGGYIGEKSVFEILYKNLLKSITGRHAYVCPYSNDMDAEYSQYLRDETSVSSLNIKGRSLEDLEKLFSSVM